MNSTLFNSDSVHSAMLIQDCKFELITVNVSSALKELQSTSAMQMLFNTKVLNSYSDN